MRSILNNLLLTLSIISAVSFVYARTTKTRRTSTVDVTRVALEALHRDELNCMSRTALLTLVKRLDAVQLGDKELKKLNMRKLINLIIKELKQRERQEDLSVIRHPELQQSVDEQRSKTSFNDLNYDALNRVMGFCDIASAHSLERVNRFAREVTDLNAERCMRASIIGVVNNYPEAKVPGDTQTTLHNALLAAMQAGRTDDIDLLLDHGACVTLDRNIRELHLEYCAVTEKLIQHVSQLNIGYLLLSGSPSTTDDWVQHVAGFTNVEYLRLCGCTSITDADLQQLARLRSLRGLRLEGAVGITDAGLQHLAGLEGLEILQLGDCTGITDVGLQHIDGLIRLRALYLNGCTGITDVGLHHIAGLTNLGSLMLNGCTGITDAGLQHIAGLINLNSLDLNGCTSIRGLQYLAGLANLSQLQLCYTGISDSDLQHVVGLTNLSIVDLSYTALTDVGLQHVAQVARLNTLAVNGCTGITNAGLSHIVGLGHLWRLELNGCTGITNTGINELKNQRPSLEIFE